MTNRLPYETIGGNLSPTDTFKQLIEYLRLAEEDARELMKLCKIRHENRKADAWLGTANNFQRIQTVVSALANSKTRSSLGYRSAKSKSN